MTRIVLVAAGLASMTACMTTTGTVVTSPTTPTGTTVTTPTVTTTSPVQTTDRFVQDASDVDVLFVVDNSCSMADDQRSLIEAFPMYMNAFLGSGTDYHIGLVTTDLDNLGNPPGTNGSLVVVDGTNWLDADVPDPMRLFAAMAAVGTIGSGSEKGLGAAYLALETLADTVNAGFLRDDSALHIIVLSDEDDHTDPTLITKNEFIDWFLGLGVGRPDLSFSAIVARSGLSAGDAYIEVSDAVGGSVYDIDTVDQTIAMDLLGIANSGLKRVFCLSVAPDPATVDVTVETQSGSRLAFVQPDDFEVTPEGCVSFLEFVPEAGDTVVVSYDPA